MASGCKYGPTVYLSVNLVFVKGFSFSSIFKCIIPFSFFYYSCFSPRFCLFASSHHSVWLQLDLFFFHLFLFSSVLSLKAAVHSVSTFWQLMPANFITSLWMKQTVRNADTNKRLPKGEEFCHWFWFVNKGWAAENKFMCFCMRWHEAGWCSLVADHTFKIPWPVDEALVVLMSVNVWTSQRTQFLNHLLYFSAASVSCKCCSGALNPFKAVLTITHLHRHTCVISLFRALSLFHTSLPAQPPFTN